MNPAGVGKFGYLTKIIGEIDLAAIQRESQRRFQVLVAGPEQLSTALAEALSHEKGKSGVHPWLRPASLETAEELTGLDLALVILKDLEPTAGAVLLIERLREAGVPVLSVLVTELAREAPGAALPRPLEQERVLLDRVDVPTVETKLAPAFLRFAPPEMRLALARQLPILRPCQARVLIEETARANAVYAASSGLASVVPILNIPLGVADTVVLTKNQLVMAYRLALASGKSGRPLELMGEVASVLGGGLLFRQVARGLVGLLPVVGIVPNTAVAYAGTQVIGQAVRVWATQGKAPEVSELRRGYRDALAAGRTVARSLVARGWRLGRRARDQAAAALPQPRRREALPAPADQAAKH